MALELEPAFLETALLSQREHLDLGADARDASVDAWSTRSDITRKPPGASLECTELYREELIDVRADNREVTQALEQWRLTDVAPMVRRHFGVPESGPASQG